MKAIIVKNQFICIGKFDEIISYITELQDQYKTVKEYIEEKQKPLRKELG